MSENELPMLRYAISDRTLFPDGDASRQRCLIEGAVTLAHEGVQFFQLREKDLGEQALFPLILKLQNAIRTTGAPMQLVLNGPRHLAERAGIAWHGSAGSGTAPSLSCSVHTLAEVEQHRTRTSLLLFAPVFDKTITGQSVQPGVGLQLLREAVDYAQGTPVLALGGITLQNAHLCIEAGATGIAGIRIFHR